MFIDCLVLRISTCVVVLLKGDILSNERFVMVVHLVCKRSMWMWWIHNGGHNVTYHNASVRHCNIVRHCPHCDGCRLGETAVRFGRITLIIYGINIRRLTESLCSATARYRLVHSFRKHSWHTHWMFNLCLKFTLSITVYGIFSIK